MASGTITRTYTFTDGTTAYGSQVESEISNITNTVNNCDAGINTWTVTDTTLLRVADGTVGAPSCTFHNSTTDGIYRIGVNNYGFAANGVKQMEITTSGLTLNSKKIQGLANGTAATDAAAFGQLKYFQTVQATTSTDTGVNSATFGTTNLAATITPTSSSNRIKISVSGALSTTGTSNGYLTIKRGSTELSGVANGFANVNNGTSSTAAPVAVVFIDSPATTSATTYTVFIRSDTGTAHFPIANLGVMILEEIV